MRNILLSFYRRKFLHVNTILLVGMAFHMLSCNNDELVPEEERIPELTASVSSIVLSQEKANENAVKLSWTAGSNYGTHSGIEYSLQFDKRDNEFASPINVELGRQIYSKTYKVSDLNKLLVEELQITAGTTAEIEVRVKSKVLADGIEPDFSKSLSLSVTTYEPLAGPDYNELWIVGDATPKGWDIGNADKFTQSQEDPYIFTFSALLTSGEFKIATAKNWDDPFYRPALGTEGNGQLAPISHTSVQLSAGDPDHKWLVEEEGFYKITLNLYEMTISVQPVVLYMIGDATPNGWNIGTPAPMTRNGSTYTYSGALVPGEFKISKFKGDWCQGEWINSATPDQDVLNPNFIFTWGCEGPDNKWKVTAGTAGNYTVSFNLTTNTMTITAQ